MYDVLIIGGGPGGIYTGIISSLRYLNSCIIEASNMLGGQPMSLYPEKHIEDIPGVIKITGKEFTDSLINQLDSLKAHKPDVFLNARINEITQDKGSHFKVTLNDGKVLEAKAIIIATGLGVYEPIRLDENEINLKNTDIVSYCFNADNLKGKRVLVLGGGDSALDWANHLVEQNLTNNVSILHRRDEWRAREDKVTKLSKNNINIYMNKKITSIDGHKVTLIDNETNIEQSLEFDKILVQYGVKLNTNNIITVFKDIHIDANRKILVDINCKTSYDLIYAIGNACEYDCAPNMILNSMSDGSRAVYHLRKKIKE